MDAFHYYLIRAAYGLLFHLLAIPVLALFFAPMLAVKALTGGTNDLLGIIGVLGWVAVLLAIGWLSNRAARKHSVEGASFAEALFSALSEGRVYCVYLPVVGRLFAPRGAGRRPN